MDFISDDIAIIKRAEENLNKQIRFHIDDCIRAERKVIALENQLDELKRYFTSANEIPVERATILAKDFWKIVVDLEDK